MSIRTEQTRSAITQAALSTFCERGYGVATLEEIGTRVGLTRGGVLHHFKSKPDLLDAVAGPFRRALTVLLDAQIDDPPTEGQRRRLLSGFADLILEHRGTLRLLANDVSARAQLALSDQRPMQQGKLVRLLAGSKATNLTRLRAAAALGAMIHPVASEWLNLGDVATRTDLIDAAVAVIDGRRTLTNAATTSRDSVLI
jgi:AcrR family transcriptional regulator